MEPTLRSSHNNFLSGHLQNVINTAQLTTQPQHHQTSGSILREYLSVAIDDASSELPRTTGSPTTSPRFYLPNFSLPTTLTAFFPRIGFTRGHARRDSNGGGNPAPPLSESNGYFVENNDGTLSQLVRQHSSGFLPMLSSGREMSSSRNSDSYLHHSRSSSSSSASSASSVDLLALEGASVPGVSTGESDVELGGTTDTNEEENNTARSVVPYPPVIPENYIASPADVPNHGGGVSPTYHPTIDLQLVLKWLENNLIFILLLSILFLYKHKHGIFTYVWLFSILYHSSHTLEKQITLQEHRKVTVLLILLTIIGVHISFIFSFFKGEVVWLALVATPGRQLSFQTVIWVVLMNDIIVRYVSLLSKCLITITFLSAKRRKKLYVLTYQVSGFLRTVLPIRLWFSYFLSFNSDDDGGFLLGCIIEAIYLSLKIKSVVNKLSCLGVALRALFIEEMPFGDYATKEQLEENMTCPICQDTPTNAVALKTCQHVYCFNCITEWFERDDRTTCPVCRKVCSTAITYNRSEQLIYFF
eukprot:TRINITY_DN3688_c0_g2_i1.p1 TRINITY_DN3688_c0_g2~~TRINITY_DN3688_c0_g2_i1.p1  ORF type:complete len:530 (+),score=39.18 TRINITY_DN3688_c0_g2_i1:156-1745(+)